DRRRALRQQNTRPGSRAGTSTGRGFVLLRLSGPFSPSRSVSGSSGNRIALEVGVDLGEQPVQAGAERGQRANDGDGDQGRDQAILDSRGAVLVLQKLLRDVDHGVPSLCMPRSSPRARIAWAHIDRGNVKETLGFLSGEFLFSSLLDPRVS